MTQRKRKSFKRPKPKKEKSKREKPKKRSKKIITCGHKFGCVCEEHGNPCDIPVEFPEGDERTDWMNRLVELGAERHNEDSEHRCFVCEHERRRNSPFREIEVKGLKEAQAARIKAWEMENQHRFVKKPDN